jgi:uncharacterized protein (TIGR02001 family)
VQCSVTERAGQALRLGAVGTLAKAAQHAFRHTIVAAFIVVPVAAQEQKPAWHLSAEVGIVSDYRFRGISLSDRDPALQAGLTLDHSSGAYAAIWGSLIDETPGGAETEIDFILGYAAEVAPGLTLDAAGTYYEYPSDPDINYFEATSSLSYTIGSATARLGGSYAPPQDNLRDENGRKDDNLYLSGGFDYALQGTPLTLSADAGYETGYFDAASSGGKWDWRLGVAAQLSSFTLSLAYVDSDAAVEGKGGADLADAAIVASAVISF